MISLIYVSTSVKLLSDDELLDILRVSWKNNAKLNISGFLLYKGGNFMQVLEGPEDNVDMMYETIRMDPRHKDVTCISRELIDERQFSDWQMGFQNLDNPEVKNEPGYSQFIQDDFTADAYRVNRQLAYIMLLTFRDGLR